MTIKITYENGRLNIEAANGAQIDFRVCDLQYKERAELVRAVGDVAPVKEAGEVGFLKTQPVEQRERVIEEILGRSLSPINVVGYLKTQPVCVRARVVEEIIGRPLSEILGGDDDDSGR